MKYYINTDGASRGNPGPASYGFVIKDENKNLIFSQGKKIGINTNNVAEYLAVLEAFKLLKINNEKSEEIEIIVIADSLLIISQLQGRYKIKSEKLKEIYTQIKELEKEFQKVEYMHVLREYNKEADKLANMALDNLI